MYLVMHLNGEEVARTELLSTSKISQEMNEFRQKYKKEIQRAKLEPEFHISEIPSSINHFQSLSSNAKNQNGLQAS